MTVSYRGGPARRRTQQTIRLAVGPRTVIMNENNSLTQASALREGMRIDAAFSSAMTRSIPPQAQAFFIQIVGRPMTENVITGRILNVDRNGRNFTVIDERDFSSAVRFNVTDDTRILDRQGNLMRFSRLDPGMRVRVRHGDVMTASIPPQTQALEVRVL